MRERLGDYGMKATRPIFFLLLLLFCLPSQASSLEKYKSDCAEIGFTVGTEKFGECVLELRRRDADKKGELATKTKDQTDQNSNAAEVAALNALIAESRRQHEAQMKAYREAQSRARQQQLGSALMQFGLGMAQSGQVPAFNPNNGGFSAPPRVDQSCVNSCLGLGYLLGLCRSKCSF